jgi:hypothetical protein
VGGGQGQPLAHFLLAGSGWGYANDDTKRLEYSLLGDSSVSQKQK